MKVLIVKTSSMGDVIHTFPSIEDARRKLEYDLFYIKNFSLLRDLGIMLQTLRVVLWPEGVR